MPRLHLPVLIALLALLGACGSNPTPLVDDLPPATVKTATVSYQTTALQAEVMGTVTAAHSVNISSLMNGTILELPIALGQTVAQGEVLARIEAGQVRAKLEQARSQHRLALREYQRAQQLFSKQATTQTQLDLAQAQADTAGFAVQEAEALLAYATPQAPFAGIITAKMVEQGDLAMSGRPICTLADPGKLRLEAHVAEANARSVAVSDTLPVTIESAQLHINGTVGEIAPTADPNTRTVSIKVDLPPHPALRIGQFGRLRIPQAASKMMTVPNEAILRRGQLDFVMVVDKGKAHLRLITLGRRDAARSQVIAGLDEGSVIITQDPGKVQDGQSVQATQP